MHGWQTKTMESSNLFCLAWEKTQASSVLFLPKSMSGFQLKGATLSFLVCETLKKAIVAHP